MALNIKLEAFEGPLDLLLHLIEKERIDIYDIPIAELTDQYLTYLTKMDEAHLDLASEFLVMAATLLSIKSKMLLPKQKPEAVQLELAAATDTDPREELVTRLLEYKRYKEIAAKLKELEAAQSKIYKKAPEDLSFLKKSQYNMTDITIDDVISAYLKLINRQKKTEPIHVVKKDPMPISRKVKEIFKFICSCKNHIKFSFFLKKIRSKTEKIVTFLAILELIKTNKISAKQDGIFGEIIMCKKKGADSWIVNKLQE